MPRTFNAPGFETADLETTNTEQHSELSNGTPEASAHDANNTPLWMDNNGDDDDLPGTPVKAKAANNSGQENGGVTNSGPLSSVLPDGIAAHEIAKDETPAEQTAGDVDGPAETKAAEDESAADTSDQPADEQPASSPTPTRTYQISDKARIDQANKDVAEAALELARLTGARKLAKKQFDLAVEVLHEVIENCSSDQEEDDSPAAMANPAGSQPTSEIAASNETATEASETSPAASDDPDAWKSVSVAEIWKGKTIRGFGPKKQEALLEACPTIGELEQRRGAIGGLARIKGISPALAEEITELVLNWLTSNRDAGVFSTARAGQGFSGTTETTSDTAGGETSGETDQSETEVNQDAEQEEQEEEIQPMTDEERTELLKDAAQIFDRAKELNDGTTNCLDSHHPGGDASWNSGSEAFGRGWGLEECPYVPGLEQDDWIRGYLGQQLLMQTE